MGCRLRVRVDVRIVGRVHRACPSCCRATDWSLRIVPVESLSSLAGLHMNVAAPGESIEGGREFSNVCRIKGNSSPDYGTGLTVRIFLQEFQNILLVIID